MKELCGSDLKDNENVSERWGSYKLNSNEELEWVAGTPEKTVSSKSTSTSAIFDIYKFDIDLTQYVNKDANNRPIETTVYFKIDESENPNYYQQNVAEYYVKVVIKPKLNDEGQYEFTIEKTFVNYTENPVNSAYFSETSRRAAIFVNTPKSDLMVEKKWVDETGRSISSNEADVQSINVKLMQVTIKDSTKVVDDSGIPFSINITNNAGLEIVNTVPAWLPIGSVVHFDFSYKNDPDNNDYLFDNIINAFNCIISDGSENTTPMKQLVSKDGNNYSASITVEDNVDGYVVTAFLEEWMCKYIDDIEINIYSTYLGEDLKTSGEVVPVGEPKYIATITLNDANSWCWNLTDGLENGEELDLSYYEVIPEELSKSLSTGEYVYFTYYFEEDPSPGAQYEFVSMSQNNKSVDKLEDSSSLASISGKFFITNKFISTGFTLPETGGSGERLYITAGCCLIAISATTALITNRKKFINSKY